MRYLAIRDGLVLVEQVVAGAAKSTAKAVTASTNHILIYDRSYSMSCELSQLGKDLVSKIEELPVGDTVTLGWFSGEGEHNFILKGFKITEDQDYSVLKKAITQNLTPVGCTCFSEILGSTDQVLKDLSVLSDDFTLTFFTDGYPLVSNYTREINSIKTAIESVEGRVSSGLFVGYGNYYNKSLMTDMADRLGGSLAHCSSLAEYKNHLTNFYAGVSEAGRKVKVPLVTDTSEKDLVFSIVGQSVNSYKPSQDNSVSFVPKKSSDSQLYVVTRSAPEKAQEVKVGDLAANDPLFKGAYGAALLLTQKAKSDEALEVLGTIGDVGLIDQVNNAYTLDELGKAEGKIKRAVTHTKARFTDGKNDSYLPSRDAFCLLDALDVLLADENNFFLPYHKDFNYRRIGLAGVPAEGYPEFIPDSEVKCPLSSLVWHQKKLNLSIRAKIPGTVGLDDDAQRVGFQTEYPTYVYRNYALVKDGFLNIGKLPVVLSASTKAFFEEKGLMEIAADGTEILALEKIPVINRAVADGYTSATDLCRRVYKETVLQAQLKGLRAVKSELVEVTDDKLLSDAQLDYLAKHGIGKNGYAPPVEKKKTFDYYYANEFAVKVKGLSSLPSVADVRKKMTSGKKLTASGLLVAQGLDLASQVQGSVKVQSAMLDDMIQTKSSELLQVRQKTQRTKFAILLASKWFDEFDSREDSELTVDGNNFTIEVRKVTVDI